MLLPLPIIHILSTTMDVRVKPPNMNLFCWRLLLCLMMDTSFATEIASVNMQNNAEIPLWFHPPKVDGLVVGHLERIHVLVNETASGLNGGLKIFMKPEDNDVVEVVGNNTVFLSDLEHQFDINDTSSTHNGAFFLRGLFLGRTVINFYANIPVSYGEEDSPKTGTVSYSHDAEQSVESSEWTELSVTYHVAVVRPKRIVDTVFIACVSIGVILINIGMGCEIDINVVREVLKKPSAPAIGFCCQYLVMPLTAFGMVKLMGFEGGIALGIFATGCAPGGGNSNMYSLLTGGDVSLSITMTLFSTIASLGMIPLWLFTLGRLITKGTDIVIPYSNIFITLFSIIVPVGIGILIKMKRPAAAAQIRKGLKPILICFILFMFTFGVWTNLYVFRLITWQLIIVACVVPYFGFLVGGLVAFLLRQPRNRILTIAIETGIQNSGIPIILMKFSLPQPDADLSIISPILQSMFQPAPFWIWILIIYIRRKCGKQASDKEKEDIAIQKEELLNNKTVNSTCSNSDKELDVIVNGKPANGQVDETVSNSPNMV